MHTLSHDMKQETHHSAQLEKYAHRATGDVKNQLKNVKEALNKLTDVVVDEFETLRCEFKNDIT